MDKTQKWTPFLYFDVPDCAADSQAHLGPVDLQARARQGNFNRAPARRPRRGTNVGLARGDARGDARGAGAQMDRQGSFSRAWSFMGLGRWPPSTGAGAAILRVLEPDVCAAARPHRAAPENPVAHGAQCGNAATGLAMRQMGWWCNRPGWLWCRKAPGCVGGGSGAARSPRPHRHEGAGAHGHGGRHRPPSCTWLDARPAPHFPGEVSPGHSRGHRGGQSPHAGARVENRTVQT
jgi:hypothetical protein